MNLCIQCAHVENTNHCVCVVQVLACVLANRLVPPNEVSLATPLDDIPAVEEEKKESIPEYDFAEPEDPEPPPVFLKTWDNRFGACICGTSSSFKDCLSIVLCRSCYEPLHGICAGFNSMEHLQAETCNATVKDCVVPLCSSSRCPTCMFTHVHKTYGLIQSRATLIVTPPAILTQWEREIRRHATLATEASGHLFGSPLRTMTSEQGLKVIVYHGVKELCNQSHQAKRSALVGSNCELPQIHLIHPQILADADIVLMTFDALMGDLGHSDDNPYVSSGRQLRTEKRYRVLPSPLTSIKWWRVCLDEAQRVETPTATSAKMALKLEAHHRWCVSGTPIGRGKLDDLYGLFSFLKLGPFSNKKWFQLCLQPGHGGVEDRIKHLLSSAAWRSTKALDSVKTQIGIPEQAEKKVILKFSSIERHFYERQLEATMMVASDVMGKRSNGKSRKTADDLLASHLHRLRAACCHPQVGSKGIALSRKARKAHSTGGDDGHRSVSVSSGVLSMDQILDRLIDDARVKCEEAQRLAVLHTNALASLARLKVEARHFGVEQRENDEFYLTQSCRSYLESLELTDMNAKPSMVVGEALLSGCKGFLVNNGVVRDGKAQLGWHIRDEGHLNGNYRELWSRLDFEGPSKKIVEIRVRPVSCRLAKDHRDYQDAADSIMLIPRECVFQVSSSAVGGEFVDVVSFSLPEGGVENFDWLTFGSFHTNRSKSWRLVIKDYHHCEAPLHDELQVFYVGLELQLLEPDIAADSLQRLHVLHNGSLSMKTLLHHYSKQDESSKKGQMVAPFMSVPSIKEKAKWMDTESRKIENLYMGASRSVHAESQRQLRNARLETEEMEGKLSLVSSSSGSGKNSTADCWHDAWWNDLLSMVFLYGSVLERSSLCERVLRDLADFVETQEGERHESRSQKGRHRSFPQFSDVDGLRAALELRFLEKQENLGSLSHPACMKSVLALSPHPSQTEIANNAQCKKCRADWNQTGPECKHCQLETKLDQFNKRDPVIDVILKSLHRWLTETKTHGKLGSQRKDARIDKRAKYFFDVLKSSERELRIARVAWRTHFDLLSDLDEMNQCKRTIRLAGEDEDLTKLTADELGSIVVPCDIAARCMDHAAKQAMALATLRRSKDTLRYLKNQNKERLEDKENANKPTDGETHTDDNVCIVCLSPFGGERAVLACGHAFHYTPCLERLMSKGGNHQSISCPLRCTTRTKRDEVMIASERRRDDGSQSSRKVKGSWGTKVTRLLSDVMEVSDRAEKSIIFSQWEDMLEVVEQALIANGVEYVRVKTVRKIGECVKVFRSSDCTVLLLNVKNGAEGLTLVEATHVFMVEPLLNCGLDSQGIIY